MNRVADLRKRPVTAIRIASAGNELFYPYGLIGTNVHSTFGRKYIMFGNRFTAIRLYLIANMETFFPRNGAINNYK